MKRTLFILMTLWSFTFLLQNCGTQKEGESTEETKGTTDKEETAKEEEENPDAELQQDVKEYATLLCSVNEAQTAVSEAENEEKKKEAEKLLEEKNKEQTEFDKRMEEKYGNLEENRELQDKVFAILKDELLKACDLDISNFLNPSNAEEEIPEEEPPVLEEETPEDEEF